jgi:hypothetical protein
MRHAPSGLGWPGMPSEPCTETRHCSEPHIPRLGNRKGAACCFCSCNSWQILSTVGACDVSPTAAACWPALQDAARHTAYDASSCGHCLRPASCQAPARACRHKSPNTAKPEKFSVKTLAQGVCLSITVASAQSTDQALRCACRSTAVVLLSAREQQHSPPAAHAEYQPVNESLNSGGRSNLSVPFARQNQRPFWR